MRRYHRGETGKTGERGPGRLVRHWRAARAASLLVGTLALAGLVGLAGCGALVTTPPPPVHATYSTHITTPRATPSAAAPVYANTLATTTTPSGWSTQSVCSFTPQGLVVQPSGGQAYICLAPAASLSDLSVTVRVQQLSGSATHAYGVVFHHNEPKSYYFFGVDSSGHYTLTVVTHDVSQTVIPFTANSAIHAGVGATNILQIVSVGPQVTLFVNGTAVGEATLSTFASGTVGLRGINDGQARFSHLTIAKG